MRYNHSMNLDDFDHLLIKEYTNWKVQLYSNQAYLGRCVIIFKGNKQDLADTTLEEFIELHKILGALKNALTKAFSPTKFNYICNGNQEPQLHMHVFPRYDKPVLFNNVEFKDVNWGKKPYPYDEDFKVDEGSTSLIIKTIKERLEEN